MKALTPEFHLRAGRPGDLASLCEVDRDAAELFTLAGLHLDLPDDHEFPAAETERWRRSLAAGTALLAVDIAGVVAGFAALGERDGEAFVEQLAVRRSHMRRGIGGALLAAGASLAARNHSELWLTTYDHLEWNRPYYERHGFTRVAEQRCAAEVRAVMSFERRWLPFPERRVAMRKPLPGVRHHDA